MDPTGRIFLALDGLKLLDACNLLYGIAGSSCAATVAGVKVHDLCDDKGISHVVVRLRDAVKKDIWVDYKLHDTPETVGLRVKAVKGNGASITTVHTSGGLEMMRRAVVNGPKILGITVLTSLSEEDVHLLHGQPSKAAVLYRARMAKLAGLWGVVCSPNEVGILAKETELQGLEFVTPGIRLGGSGAVDANQKRVNSPTAAFEAGATRIVVGSEVTKAEYPIAVIERIVKEIERVNTR